jgi:hypothetical protein
MVAGAMEREIVVAYAARDGGGFWATLVACGWRRAAAAAADRAGAAAAHALTAGELVAVAVEVDADDEAPADAASAAADDGVCVEWRARLGRAATLARAGGTRRRASRLWRLS